MRVINIVDRLDKVNYGIYNAAVFTGKHLKETHGVDSEIWFPEVAYDPVDLNSCRAIPLKDNTSKVLKAILNSNRLDPANDIIVTHGAWRFPTRWGHTLQKHGFKWVYVPHGMLEPWSVKQKRLKKSAYLRWFEVPYARNANAIRAVGKPEQEHLREWFSEPVLIPNGIEPTARLPFKKGDVQKVLFMGRLHHKKGVIPLVKAWQQSDLYTNPNFELLIAGPDDGELKELKALLSNQPGNIQYLGAVYGDEKKKLLSACSFYILPSASEGFPTSVLEAMQYELIPIITDGCNFPELYEAGIGFRTEQKIEAIRDSLHALQNLSANVLPEQARLAMQFVTANYSLEHIANQQFQLYHSLLYENKTS